MSEGRIPVSGLDIRHTVINTTHLIDESVTTPKIADVAVTIEKTDDPVWAHAAEAPNVVDAAVTTAWLEVISHTIDIPSWVGTLSLLSIGSTRLRNSSGGVQGYIMQVRHNDVSSGTAWQDVPNGSIGQFHHIESFAISSPGASIEVSVRLATITGTNNDNVVNLDILAFGVR